MRKWKIYIGCACFFILCVSKVQPHFDELSAADAHDLHAAEQWEASGKKSYVEDNEANPELPYSSSKKSLEKEACQLNDCPPFENSDESELQLMYEQEENDMDQKQVCNSDGKCSRPTLEAENSGRKETGNFVAGSEKDLESADENTAQTDGVDDGSVFENIPLREILLKLKPVGLSDDEEEDINNDYTTTEGNVGEEQEVDGETLVSSGSSDEQTDTISNNSSIDSSNGGNGGNSGSTNTGSKKAVCLQINGTETIQDVEIINATTLMKLLQGDPNITSRTLAGPCYLIYFFSPYCPFSVMGSPYVNALARSLPNIPVYGLDSIQHHGVNARYGVMGTPTLLLFHNGNGIGRYNASEYSVNQLISFVNHYTDQEISNINVTSSDFQANLPSTLAEGRPYALWAAWIFLLSCASWLFLTSELCARLTEAILNNWREAEAQHDHQD